MHRRPTRLTAAAFLLLAALACDAAPEVTVGSPAAAQPRPASTPTPPPASAPAAEQPADTGAVDAAAYPWLADMEAPLPATRTLRASFPTPPGLTRVEPGAGSYGGWLGGLPIRRDRTAVLSFRGDTLRAPSAAVVLLDVGDRDLQQCADTALRLHAEYLWHIGKSEGIAYHFTSGDRSAWADWARGERFKIEGNRVSRVRTGKKVKGHAAFRDYLQHLFRFAGTQSLWLDSNPILADATIEAGDFFVTPGAPGHAVIVLDVAVDPQGHRWALIGQGFMPAQELHVLRADGDHTLQGVWFKLPEGAEDELNTPSWSPFPRSSARRFKAPR